MEQTQGDTLKRGLKNRHIQLIALGGAVGTGLFLGIADTIQHGGPVGAAGLRDWRLYCLPDHASAG